MRPLPFLTISFIGFFVLAAAYALIIDNIVIPKRTVPFPYRQFLLQASEAIKGKVIIDSGSNSIHGIDTYLLSEYFRAPTFIVADGAGYPLRNKIFRLKRYMSNGDVLLLPLEWIFYRQESSLSKTFLSALADKNLSLQYYFNELPPVEKLRFIFTQYPLTIALESLSTRDAIYISKSNHSLLKEYVNRLQLKNNESFGGSLRNGPEAMDSAAARVSCDSYDSPFKAHSDYLEISSDFRSALAPLKDLAKSGVAIYFAWPSVVDSAMSTCYKDPEYRKKIHQFSKAIVELVEANGFKFIGEIEDSHFTSECFLNTYYHLRYSCAKERTNRLIDALQREHITPINSSHTQADLIATATEFAKKLKASLPK